MTWPTLRTPYDRQPFKSAFVLYRSSILLLFKVPLWTLRRLLRLDQFPRSYSLGAVIKIQLARQGTRILRATGNHRGVLEPSTSPEELNASAKVSRAQWITRPSDERRWIKGVAVKAGCEAVDMIGVVWSEGGKPVEDLKVGNGETVYLNLHGGGLGLENPKEDNVTSGFPRSVLKGCSSISHAISINYRKVNTGPFPMQLVDCITAYAYLIDVLHVSPSQILVGGDSAGGHLALCLVRYLRDELEVELPRAMILSSPVVDMSYWLGPKMELDPSPNQGLDYLDVTVLGPWIAPLLLRDNPISLLDSAYLSPAAPSVPATPELFAGFPPCYVTAGANEWYARDLREFVRRLEISAVPHVYYEEPEAPHDFMLLLAWDKAKVLRARELMAAWIDDQFAA